MRGRHIPRLCPSCALFGNRNVRARDGAGRSFLAQHALAAHE
jgi:hypothetical protein